jgi:carbamoyltransferase
VSSSHPYILGVNSGSHDATAALFRGPDLLCVVEQERLSRQRWAIDEPPADAIRACLASVPITLNDIAAIAVGWDVPLLYAQEGRTYDNRAFLSHLLGPDADLHTVKPQIHFFPHHLAHAASGMWTSGFDAAVVLVVDGRGEDVATTALIGTRDSLDVVSTFDITQSLGHLYGVAAEWAGFGYEGGGKLMGLAGYGRPNQAMPVTTRDGAYNISTGARPPSTDYPALRASLSSWFTRHCFPFQAAVGPRYEPLFYGNFSASVQQALERAVLELLSGTCAATGLGKVVLVGGVALNCSLNGRIARSSVCDGIYVPPFPYDAGVAIGAGLLLLDELGLRRRAYERLRTATLCPPVPAGEVESALAGLRERFVASYDDAELVELVAGHLAEGAVVGWWQGAAEVGKRALGARSILADPRSLETRIKVNRIKGREQWRPVAPSVLAKHTESTFHSRAPAPADFMLAAMPVSDWTVTTMPAIVHVDGTARPHVVAKDSPMRYQALIEAFAKMTSCPALVNTSFNLAGEPIVYSIEDALRCFDRSALDFLVIDNYLIGRPRSRTLRP